ncbi:hypothetical protein SAMN05216411_103238 [Nitrosospira multiformis]|nr:hypothetical protein SAMN05216411_103238 [Nitrosospira multiformis]
MSSPGNEITPAPTHSLFRPRFSFSLHAFTHIKISIQAAVSCILRASTKSPNSITAFFGPSFLTVSELFRFSSFQRKLAAPWLAAMFETPDQSFTGSSSGFLCMCAGRPAARPFSRVRPACALESASKNQFRSPDSDTTWNEKHSCAELDSFVVTLLVQNPSK